MANSVDPDETSHSVASHLCSGLSVNTYGDYVPYLPENLTSPFDYLIKYEKKFSGCFNARRVDPDQGNIKLA